MPKLIERVTVTERYLDEQGEVAMVVSEHESAHAPTAPATATAPTAQAFDGLPEPPAEVSDEQERMCPCPPRAAQRTR